jgi:hypothetical protein
MLIPDVRREYAEKGTVMTSAHVAAAISQWTDERLRSEVQLYPDRGSRTIREKHLHLVMEEADRRGLSYSLSR